MGDTTNKATLTKESIYMGGVVSTVSKCQFSIVSSGQAHSRQVGMVLKYNIIIHGKEEQH